MDEHRGRWVSGITPEEIHTREKTSGLSQCDVIELLISEKIEVARNMVQFAIDSQLIEQGTITFKIDRNADGSITIEAGVESVSDSFLPDSEPRCSNEDCAMRFKCRRFLDALPFQDYKMRKYGESCTKFIIYKHG